jgi:hypothetical protein
MAEEFQIRNEQGSDPVGRVGREDWLEGVSEGCTREIEFNESRRVHPQLASRHRLVEPLLASSPSAQALQRTHHVLEGTGHTPALRSRWLLSALRSLIRAPSIHDIEEPGDACHLPATSLPVLDSLRVVGGSREIREIGSTSVLPKQSVEDLNPFSRSIRIAPCAQKDSLLGAGCPSSRSRPSAFEATRFREQSAKASRIS